MDFRFETDEDVEAAVKAASSEACQVLDALFAGFDKDGITSNFQGHLKNVLTEMLKGHAPAIHGQRPPHLPKLVVDETFFGNPLQGGDGFLVTKFSDPIWEKDQATGRFIPQRHLLALDLDTQSFRPISQVSDAWTSFELAASSAIEYLKKQGFSMEQALAEGLSVRAVTPNVEGGYSVDAGIKIAG